MAEAKKSNLSRAFAEDGERKTHVGGQALLEGIMMRGKLNWAVAVREPDGGIYTESHDLASGKEKNKWMSWPIVRGCVAMVESLALGFRALEISVEHGFEDEDEPKTGSRQAEAEVGEGIPEAHGQSASIAQPGEAADKTPVQAECAAISSEKESAPPQGILSNAEMAISMVLGIVLAVALFIVLPAWLTNLIVGEFDSAPVQWNVLDGVLRVVVFIFYIWIIGRMSDIKRMFAYHGAEHKTIHCYEHGLPLTPENARSFPRLHVRCGTAFLIMVMVIAILVYTIIPVKALIAAWGVPDGALKLLLVIAVRIVFIPLIAGISYEITVKWAGARPDNPVVKVVLWPGMMMQYLTTNEPDDSMLECAIEAMSIVLAREQQAAKESQAA